MDKLVISAEDRSVIVDAVRSAMLEINGITGSETVKAGKGLRDCYSAVELRLNIAPNKLPETMKEAVRFEFDGIIQGYTTSSQDWQLQSIRQKYGAKDGKAIAKRNASWRNDNIPPDKYPQVIAQLGEDVKRLTKAMAEQNAVGNADGASKIAGRIRQAKNNAAILAAEHAEWLAKRNASVTVEQQAALDEVKEQVLASAELAKA